jgi:hypothetical protein
VTQLKPGFVFQQGHGEEFSVDRPEALQGSPVDPLHECRQLAGHAMFTRQRGSRREFLAAAVQPEEVR